MDIVHTTEYKEWNFSYLVFVSIVLQVGAEELSSLGSIPDLTTSWCSISQMDVIPPPPGISW